jgi:membrane-associated protease RseP (regulator of RpoE activity)
VRRTVLLVAIVFGILASPLHGEERQPISVPFDLLLTKHIVVQIKINGKGPYRMIFDTGAPVSLVNSRVARATGLLAKDAATPLFNLFGPVEQVKMKTLQLGDLKAAGVPIIVMDHPTVEVLSKILGPVEGILGFPFFARYRMTLDYQAKQMTFVPNGFEPTDVIQGLMTTLMAREQPKTSVLAPAGLWGVSVDKPDRDDEAGVLVKAVLPDSPAAKAGLRAGDRLLSLDGRWTDTVADCYRAAAYVPAGTAAVAVVQREGKELELTVTPAAGL